MERKLNTKKKKKKVPLPPPPHPPRPKKKKPFLRFPKLKFPKLPKAQPLQRRTKPAPKKKLKKPLLPPPLPSRPEPALGVPVQAAPGPGQSRKGQIPHPKNLLGKVKDIFTGHKRFLKRREGNPIAQSTAVL